MNDPRAERFIPLNVATPGPRNRADLHVTVLTQADQAQALQSLRPPTAPAPVQPAPACEPKVSLQREGDRVTAIQIECSCGRVIELACDY